MRRVKRFGVYQTAKVSAIIYTVCSAVILIPIGLMMSMFGGNSGVSGVFPLGGGVFFLVLPLIYGIFGFIFTAIGCAVYNLVAKWTGGIEVEVETENAAAYSPALDAPIP